MSTAAISKIHVASSTGLSLNERFTAMASRPEPRRRSRSRSRSRQREAPRMSPTSSIANRRLLQQLAKRYMMQAALKLKRRSMRTVGGTTAGGAAGIKTIRVAANGHPIKTNSRNRIATMNADFVKNRGRPLSRSNSMSNRIGRPLAGGAAERVARRRLERLAGDGGRKPFSSQRGRSRSRSRSRTRLPRQAAEPVVRGRGRSRSRGRIQQVARANIPIKNRLGIRPGTTPVKTRGRANSRNRLARNKVRAIADGRVNKRTKIGGAGEVQTRGRSRSRLRRGVKATEGSRSRTRRGSVGPQQANRQQRKNRPQQNNRQQLNKRLQRSGPMADGGRRRGQGRNMVGKQRKNLGKPMQKTGNGSKQNAQRRGRSRSRGPRNGGQNLGKN